MAITTPSCNTSTLVPYTPTTADPWNTARIRHVYRRLGFGTSQATVDAALSLSPGELIDNLVDTAVGLPATPAPSWGYFALSDFTDYENENPQFIEEWQIQTGNDLISEDLRGRLTFFWTNHFVTELEVYNYAPYLFQYYHILQTDAIGNFKTLVYDIGINPAMLLYLNGFENTQVNPNENYARELFELFTLGEGNGYTESDITEASRALTGYNHWDEPGAAIYFDPSTFDGGQKTIFGQTGPWDYTDLIDILFQERGQQIAEFICDKLYRFFVSPAVDNLINQDIIQPLAQTMLAANFELAPVLKQLFKSAHFFDERAQGVVIKSPVDLMFSFVNESTFYYDNPIMAAFLYYASLMGQTVYNPPDVSGWQRDESWINTSTLTTRWQLLQLYVDYLLNNGFELSLTDLAKDLTNNSNDPEFITQVMVDHFTARGFHSPEDYVIATDIFKWEVPQNYYDTGQWNLDWTSAPLQVSLLLKHLARMPEFQLK